MKNKEEILRLHKQGLSYRKIGEQTGDSKSHVASVIKQSQERQETEAAVEQAAKRKGTADIREDANIINAIVFLYQEGKSVSEICHQIKIRQQKTVSVFAVEEVIADYLDHQSKLKVRDLRNQLEEKRLKRDWQMVEEEDKQYEQEREIKRLLADVEQEEQRKLIEERLRKVIQEEKKATPLLAESEHENIDEESEENEYVDQYDETEYEEEEQPEPTEAWMERYNEFCDRQLELENVKLYKDELKERIEVLDQLIWDAEFEEIEDKVKKQFLILNLFKEAYEKAANGFWSSSFKKHYNPNLHEQIKDSRSL